MLDKLRALVAERALLGMQREMEALLQDIEKVLLRIARDTSSSKQRNKCRNKKRSLEGQLKKVAAKYNKIIAALAEEQGGGNAQEMVDVERLLRQRTMASTTRHEATGREGEADGVGVEPREAEGQEDGEDDGEREREPGALRA